MNELQLSNDLNVITAEIKMLEHNMAKSLIEHGWEIGKRLSHVKTTLKHGSFGEWLEKNFGFSHQYANQFMKFYNDNPNYNSSSNFNKLPSWKHVVEVLYLPEEIDKEKFIEEEVLNEDGTAKTAKEIAELKRQNRELQQAKQQTEKQAKILEYQLQAERNKQPEVIEKQVEKIIDNTDYEKIEQLNNEINTLKQSLNRAVSQQDYEKLKRELEKKDDELLALTQAQLKAKDQQLIYSNASHLARDVGKWINKLRMDIHERAEIEGDKEVQRTLNACIKTLEEAIKEMQEWTNIKTERGVVDAEYTVIT